MSDGEGKQKYVYLLEVHRQRYRLTPIPLTTVRSFHIRDIDLAAEGFTKTDRNAESVRADVEKHLKSIIEEIVEHVRLNRGAHQPKEPLIRLRVDFGNIEPLNSILFGQQFVGQVANPRDILLPLKKRPNDLPSTTNDGLIREWVEEPIVLDTTTIEDLVVGHFSQNSEDLSLFNAKFLTEALRHFVHTVCDPQTALLTQKADLPTFVPIHSVDESVFQ
nr:MRE11 [Milnesium sp.]